MGQRGHGSCLPYLQPTVDTAQVAHPLNTEQPLCWIEEVEAQYWHILGVGLPLRLQPFNEAWFKTSRQLKFTEERRVIGANLLVDLDPVVLDGDPVLAGLRVLLDCFLDGSHLLWQVVNWVKSAQLLR
jgi:hypothetical protein